MRKSLLIAAAVLLAAFLVGGLVVPQTVPRLGVFPAPAERFWNDGCNDHHRSWSRSGPVWGLEETSTMKACVKR